MDRRVEPTRSLSDLFALTASGGGDFQESLEIILEFAARATGADGGGTLYVADRAAVELLPMKARPLRTRGEMKELAGKGEPQPFFRDTHSLLREPIRDRDTIGFVQMESMRANAFSAADARGLREVAEIAGLVVSRLLLRDHAAGRGFDVALVGSSPKLLEMERQIKVAASDPKSPVIILGERGSGKEVAAFAVHYYSRRRAMPFVPINSAAFADSLLPDELFGHERHSFTGADSKREGLLKSADGGTLFLDEVGDMSQPVQASLLRVLDQGEIRPVGSDKAMKIDVRVIVATNRNLPKMVKEGTFRADLYDRLNVFRVDVPPLRDRKDDIHLLAGHFLKKVCVSNGRHDRRDLVAPCVSCLHMTGAACARPDFYQQLSEYHFPGNVRELRNLVTRISAAVSNEEFRAEHARTAIGSDTQGGEAPDDMELDAVVRQHINKVLRLTGHNKSHAARLLGLPLTTLVHKMKKLGL
ncbi:MAG TPA: sigma-54 dependent transcriptional regulator [Thermoanaerobaculia bacterium]